jgi:hypothetical protein
MLHVVLFFPNSENKATCNMYVVLFSNFAKTSPHTNFDFTIFEITSGLDLFLTNGENNSSVELFQIL